MAEKSAARGYLQKADKKAQSSGGWFTSSSTKYEEAGDLYQQAANAFKLEKLFKEAGDAFAREAECRELCKEENEAANAWWNASKAYKRGFPDRECYPRLPSALADGASSRHPGAYANHRPPHTLGALQAGRRPREGDWPDLSAGVE